MSIKRIKFLKRKKILQKHAQVSVEANGPAKRFTVRLQLDEYDFPPDSEIWLEAKQLLETLRFSLGTAETPKPPVPIDISQLRGDRVTFKLLVLDPTNARKLGSADAIRPNIEPETSDDSIPLLPVDASARLDGLVWKVEYCESDQEGHTDAPVLMIDRLAAQESASVFVQDPVARAILLPSAMREVLTKVLLVDRSEHDPTSRSWRDSWIRFASRIAGEEPPAMDEPNYKQDTGDWIGRATGKLATTAQLLDQYLTARRP